MNDNKNEELPPEGLDISPCFCGRKLRLLKLPHPLTKEMSLALEHGDPECHEFMVDRPLNDFLVALRKHKGV